MAEEDDDVGLIPDADQAVSNRRVIATPGVSTAPEPTFGESAGAFFDYHNIAGSLVASKALRGSLFGYDSVTPMSDDELNEAITKDGLVEYTDRFLEVQSKEQYEAMRSDVYRELEDKRIIDATPFASQLALGAASGFLDLPTLIPLGHAVKLGKAAHGAYSSLRTASRLAATSAIDAGITEAALQGIQETRTAEESAYNIGGSVLFTTAVGTGVAKAVNSATAKRVGDRIKLGVDEINSGKVTERIEAVKKDLIENKAIDPKQGGPVGNPFDKDVLKPGVREDLNRGTEWATFNNRMSEEQLQVADNFKVFDAAKKVNNIFGGNTALNMLTSRFHTAREFMVNLSPSPILLKGNFDDINTPQAAKSMVARMDGIKATSTKGFIDSYREFRSGLDLFGKDLSRFSRLVSMALADNDKAPRLMAVNDRADIAGAYEDAVGLPAGTFSRELNSKERAAVEKAAKEIRKYFSEVAEYNVRAGLMRKFKPEAEYNKPSKTIGDKEEIEGPKGKSVDTTKGGEVDKVLPQHQYIRPDQFVEPESYFKHIYRWDRIMHDEPEFTRLETEAWLADWEKVNKTPFRSLDKKLQKKVYKQAFNHAKGTFRAIVHSLDSEGQTAGGGLRNMGNRRGSVLDRNVRMSSKELMKRGWIVDDVLHLMDASFRQNVTDAAIAFRFRRDPTTQEINKALKNSEEAYWIDGEDPTSVPDLAMTVPKKRLEQEAEELFALAKTDTERQAIREELAQMQQHIDDSINIVRGRYRPESHFTRGAQTLATVRDFNFATKMGNFVASSLTDAPLQILEHGPARVAQYIAKRSAERFKDILKDKDAKSIARIRRDARAASVAVETENLSRITTLADTSDPYSSFASATPFERAMKNVVFYSSRAFLVPYWNNMMMRMSYGIFQDRVVQAALDPSSLSAVDKRWLAQRGVGDREFLDKVAENFLKQDSRSRETGGLFYADPTNWDVHTQERFFAAARDTARNSIITPEALERPLVMHRPTGATFLQFMAYPIASTVRITAQAAARVRNGTNADLGHVGTTAAAMMAAAALGVNMRYFAAGREDQIPSWDENKGWWIWEIADRSGWLGLFSAAANQFEAATDLGPRRSIQDLFGDEKSVQGSTSRSIPRRAAEFIAGPTGALVSDVGSVTKDVGDSTIRLFSDDVPANKGLRASTVRKAMRSLPISQAALLRRAISNPVEQFIDEDLLGVPYK